VTFAATISLAPALPRYRRRTEPAFPQLSSDDAELVRALRAGDERAFRRLLELWGPTMLRVAQLYTSSRAVAEEVVQEAWVGVLKGLPRFEGRSSLKTWVFRILTNTAKTRGEREGRSIPFSSFAPLEDGATVDLERFYAPGTPGDGHWQAAAAPIGVPEERLLAGEARDVVAKAIDDLPENQRAVITLRDVSGFDAAETCDLLGISEINQRVLLHRARAKVRAALEQYLEAA
jgi:RNA polymerase sigma-70 factor (ECF subfamily)